MTKSSDQWMLAAAVLLAILLAGTASALNMNEQPDVVVNVTFGRLNVSSFGVNGETLDSTVSVYNQSTGASVTSGTTRAGNISFYLAPGTYKVAAKKTNSVWRENLSIVGGMQTNTTVTFGRLNVSSFGVNGEPLDSSVTVYYQSTGATVGSGATGIDGVVSFYLANGTYKVAVKESNSIWSENLSVVEGMGTETNVTFGKLNVHVIAHTPYLIDIPWNAYVAVYDQATGAFLGSGSTGPDGVISFYLSAGTYREVVRDSHDTWYNDTAVNAGKATDIVHYVETGILIVNSYGVGGERLDSTVSVYNQSTGASLTMYDPLTGAARGSVNTGTDGTVSILLLPQLYKIKVMESNAIWVENILVQNGSTTGCTTGNDPNNTPPVINSYYPAETDLSINENESITFGVNAADPDGLTPQYRWYMDGIFKSAYPSWTFLASRADAGSRNVTVEVTDCQYSVTRDWHVTVHVLQIPTRITVVPASAAVVVGNTTTFTASVFDQKGTLMAAGVTWNSSNTTVGTIDAAGVFTALAPGTARITAANGTVNGTATVYVTAEAAGKGDVSGDGAVDIVDALFIAQQTVGLRSFTTAQEAAGEVNGDGAVDIVDALFIAQATVGLRTL